jgi:hypothetical protein
MKEAVSPIDAGPAGMEWLRKSLAAGHVLAHAVLSKVDLDRGDAVVLVPTGKQQRDLPNLATGGVIQGGSAGPALERLLSKWNGRAVLLVEDDAARTGDPALRLERNLFEVPPDRIVHWTQFDPSTAHQCLRAGSTGYPTNAFLLTAEVGQVRDTIAQDPDRLTDWIGRRLIAIIVAAFDAESWLVWLAHVPPGDI